MKKNIFLIISLGSILGLNIYFRIFPIYFPQLKIQAKNIIEETIRKKATQDIYRRFPQFDPLAKNRLIKDRISEYKKQNKKEINNQIKDIYLKLKDRFQNQTGQTYLMELDCWHWARYVDNVLRFGHPGDEVIYGKQWDLLMLAPWGHYMEWDQFLFYFSAFLYKIFSLFKTVPLFTFLFYLPLFFTIIFIVVLYLFSYRHGGNIVAVVSCLFVGLAPICLQRSCAGWFDKDILSLLFPLLVIWTYLLAFDAKSFKSRLFYICLSSFCLGLFTFSWVNWWFIFAFIVIYEILSLISYIFIYFKYRDKRLALLKRHIFFFLLFLFFSFCWIIVFCGFEPLAELWRITTRTLTLTKPIMSSIWPNVYATVGELRKGTFDELANSAGNRFVFISSLICMSILLLRFFTKWRHRGFKRESFILLMIWFTVMGFACSKGIRFAIFILIPLGICMGWFISDAYQYFKNKHKIGTILILAIGFIVFGFTSISVANRASRGFFPLMDDNWYTVLNLIKEKTPQNTVINSWWDFGDWFKAAANRRVIFDGQSQDTPQAYWMAKALLTGNEDEAIGIMRMLNNGGNKAFEIINKYIKDQLQSVLLLESIIVFNPERAKQILSQFLPASDVQEVIKILFLMPPRTCFIVDPSMQNKIVAISYLGNWDFSKVYMAQNFNKKEKDVILEHLKKLGRNPQEMLKLHQEAFLIEPKDLDSWISKRLQFYSGLVNGREKEGVVFFDNGFTYVPKEQIIYSNSGHIPRSLFVLSKGELTEIVYPNANVAFSALVVKTNDGYKSIFLDRELTNSLFVRLYFFNGMGLRHFVPFIEAQEGGQYIRVFNIVW